jgi:hypothetical protein
LPASTSLTSSASDFAEWGLAAALRMGASCCCASQPERTRQVSIGFSQSAKAKNEEKQQQTQYQSSSPHITVMRGWESAHLRDANANDGLVNRNFDAVGGRATHSRRNSGAALHATASAQDRRNAGASLRASTVW